MAFLRSLVHAVRALWSSQRAEQQLDEELDGYLESVVRDKMAAGLNHEGAQRAARLEMGSREGVKQLVREAGWEAHWGALVRDVRHGVRILRRSPGFTAVAVLTLAVGIGASTAIFSIVNSLLLRPVMLRDVERLVLPLATQGTAPSQTCARDFLAWKQAARSFANLGTSLIENRNLTGEPFPQRVRAARITPDYLTTLGVQPALGRNFLPEEVTGQARSILLSYGLWQSRFGARRDLLGTTILIDGEAHLVVGVMPGGFDLPLRTELWLPLDVEATPERFLGVRTLGTVARLRAGVTPEQALTELTAISRQLQEQFPATHRGWDATVVTMRQALLNDFRGDLHRGLLAVLGAVVFLLLLASFNLANLLLVRVLGRGHEVALRAALGATRGRLMRQLATEGGVLILFGGVAGVLLAVAAVGPLLAWLPVEMAGLAEQLRDVQFDGRVLGFALALCLVTGLICGLVPALRLGRADLYAVLKERSGGRAMQLTGRRVSSSFVVLQIAISLVLLAGAGLMVRTFRNLQEIDLGYRPQHLTAFEMELSTRVFPEHTQRIVFVEQVLERVRALPGVEAAAATTNLPLDVDVWGSRFECEGRPPASESEVLLTADRLVTPGYLETIGVTLLRGRLLNEHDTADGQPVVVISELFAQTCWPGKDPIGRRVHRFNPAYETPWLAVVGVVRDVREDRGTYRLDQPDWYIPMAQVRLPSPRPVSLVVRSSDVAGLTSGVRSAVWSLNPNQPVSEARSLEAIVADVTAPQRLAAYLMGMFSTAGLALAAFGIYGTTAHTVRQRRQELGIRVALGAEPRHILRLVLGRGMTLALVGLVAGLLLALASARLLSNYVFGVAPGDPLTFAGAAFLLGGVALLACLLPALRATRVDPLIALRYE